MNALDHVTCIYHACVCLKHEDTTVYIDPLQVEEHCSCTKPANVIVVTHAHSDHYSAGDIAKIMDENTVFVTVADVAEKLMADLSVPAENIITVKWTGDTVEPYSGVLVTPVFAENKNHPRDIGIGAVIGLNGFRFYFSGDSDILADVENCDATFIVCDGKYNMPEYETRAVQQILEMKHRPAIAVPYHYGYIEDTAQNGEKLAAALEKAGIKNTLLY
jgi:Predicted Zn-dependent hydrolases of the beta-lactamase fold